MEEGVDEFSRVPEGCFFNVINRVLTSPRDACRLSVLSKAFYSAAASDVIWERFLPPDIRSILSRAVDRVDLGSSSSKKDLFFRLCDHPRLLRAPTLMRFWLDKSSGAKCYMLSAGALSFTSGYTPKNWVSTGIPDERFGEYAALLDVCWLEIVGRIESSALSPKTAYAAYLVFKIPDNRHGLHRLKQETCVTLGGVESKHTVCLHPDADAQQAMDAGVISPRTRSDGWMEVEMGEFYNETGEDGEVLMSLRENRGGLMEIRGDWKEGLIVRGIEIRPKM